MSNKTPQSIVDEVKSYSESITMYWQKIQDLITKFKDDSKR